jgi:hypothetical protein
MLAKTIVLMDSPQAMKELRTLVGEKTFKRVTAHVIDNAVDKATKVVDGSGSALKQFSTDAFIKELGIGKGVSGSRRGAISEMLKIADSPFKMDDLDKLVEIMRKIEDTPIPDVATFVARRAILGGWKSALGSFMVGAGTVSTVAGGLGMLFVTSSIFLGGSKFFARMISKPETAKSFMKALDETATTAVRRNAYVTAMRAYIKDLNTEEPEKADPKLMEHFIDMMQEIDDAIGFEGKSLSETLKQKAGEFIDLGKPQGTPEVDISKELSPGFGGDATLK